MSRKPRSDSKLDSLPGQIQAGLRDLFMAENASFKTARRWLKENHELTTSDEALGRFYSKHCATLKYSEARNLADQLGEVMSEQPDKFDELTTKAMQQRLFELAVARTGKPSDIATMSGSLMERARLPLEKEKVSQSGRRVALLEQKAAAFDELKKVAAKPGGITQATFAEIEERLKLL